MLLVLPGRLADRLNQEILFLDRKVSLGQQVRKDQLAQKEILARRARRAILGLPAQMVPMVHQDLPVRMEMLALLVQTVPMAHLVRQEIPDLWAEKAQKVPRVAAVSADCRVHRVFRENLDLPAQTVMTVRREIREIRGSEVFADSLA